MASCQTKPKRQRCERYVHTIDITNRTATPPQPSPAISASCSSFIWPMHMDEFKENVQYTRALAIIASSDERRVQDVETEYLHSLDLEELLDNTASPTIFAWVKGHSIELPDANAAHTMYTEANASLYFRSSQEMADTFIRRFCDDLGYAAETVDTGDLRGEIEVFVSRVNNTTEWHTDFMENYTLQLRGSKRWQLKAADTVRFPIRGCTPHFKNVTDNHEQQMKVHTYAAEVKPFDIAPDPEYFDDCEEVTLTPGSVLYFPSGMWHRVTCVDEDSISINISLMPASWGDMLVDTVRQLTWKSEQLRKYANVGMHDRPQATEELRQCIQRLCDELQRVRPEWVLPPPPPASLSASSTTSSSTTTTTAFYANELAVLNRVDDGVYVVNAMFGNDELTSATRHVVRSNSQLLAIFEKQPPTVTALFTPQSADDRALCWELVAKGYLINE